MWLGTLESTLAEREKLDLLVILDGIHTVPEGVIKLFSVVFNHCQLLIHYLDFLLEFLLLPLPLLLLPLVVSLAPKKGAGEIARRHGLERCQPG